MPALNSTEETLYIAHSISYKFKLVLESRGRVLNGELYAQILQKLIYLHLFTNCFMKISLQSSEPTIGEKSS